MERKCKDCEYDDYRPYEEPCITCKGEYWEPKENPYEDINCSTCLHAYSGHCSLCHKNYLWTSRTTGKPRPFSTPLIESISRVVAAAMKIKELTDLEHERVQDELDIISFIFEVKHQKGVR